MKTRIINENSEGVYIPNIGEKIIFDSEEFITIYNSLLDCNKCAFNGDSRCIMFDCSICKVSFLSLPIKL